MTSRLVLEVLSRVMRGVLEVFSSPPAEEGYVHYVNLRAGVSVVSLVDTVIVHSNTNGGNTKVEEEDTQRNYLKTGPDWTFKNFPSAIEW